VPQSSPSLGFSAGPKSASVFFYAADVQTELPEIVEKVPDSSGPGNVFPGCHSPWFVKEIFHVVSSLLSDRSLLLVSYSEAFSWRSHGGSG
jgi:hypothetical protein